MQSSRVALTALALLSLTLVLGGDSFDDPQGRHRQLEVARLRAHFDSVDAELRQAATRDLSPAQRAARATLIGWLREYREAGSFPLNDRFPDRAMPFFRDSRGVLCAMAYLIDRSGRHELVNTVAATRNNAFIPELAGDPELRTWLEGAGLSVAEAARIQPSYEPAPEEEPGVGTGYAITSILVGGSSLATLGLNALDPTRATGWAGVIAGTASLIAGAVKLDETGPTDDVAAADMIAGGSALVFGVYRLLTSTSGGLGVSGEVSISPVVMPAPGSRRLGLALHSAF
jgi:hypothetical protein